MDWNVPGNSAGDLFGMVKMVKMWPPNRGSKGHDLNHLVLMFQEHVFFPMWTTIVSCLLDSMLIMPRRPSCMPCHPRFSESLSFRWLWLGPGKITSGYNLGVSQPTQKIFCLESKVAYLCTQSILTPQNWLFWGPPNTPASYRFNHPSIGGSNDP